MSDPIIDDLAGRLAAVDVEGTKAEGSSPDPATDAPTPKSYAEAYPPRSEEEEAEDGRITAYKCWFDQVEALVVEAKAQPRGSESSKKSLKRAAALSAQIVTDITPVYSTTRQRTLYGPSMYVTAFAFNQYADILFLLGDLTQSMRHTWMAQDILEHRGSIEWNFGVGQKDLDLLRELQNNANERRQLIQNLSQSSPEFLASQALSFDPAKAYAPWVTQHAPPEEEWQANRERFDNLVKLALEGKLRGPKTHARNARRRRAEKAKKAAAAAEMAVGTESVVKDEDSGRWSGVRSQAEEGEGAEKSEAGEPSDKGETVG